MNSEKITCRSGHETTRKELLENGCSQCYIDELLKDAEKLYCPYCGKQAPKEFSDGDDHYIEISCTNCVSAPFRIYIHEDESSNFEDDKEPRECYDPDYASEQYRKMIEGEF